MNKTSILEDLRKRFPDLRVRMAQREDDFFLIIDGGAFKLHITDELLRELEVLHEGAAQEAAHL